MPSVIGVRFRNAGKLYYFDPGQLWPTAGDAVIVETVRGIEYGEAVTGVREVGEDEIALPLKKVIRIATPEDAQHEKQNRLKERDAMALCQKKVDEHKLQMKLVGCEYTFDNSKILFYFTSDKRVDFRLLVKDLASAFRTRIELRQIGVRDEAKMMGGLGLCGRPVCCAAFLGDFQPVSIKMAKEQNLSLNPTKISGVCGRLMCCLKYEEDHYETTRKRMPRVGKDVLTPDGGGVVVDINVLKETVRVRIPKGDGTEVKDYALADVQRPAAPAERKPLPVKRAPEAPAAAQPAQDAAAPVKQAAAPAPAAAPKDADIGKTGVDELTPDEIVVEADADELPLDETIEEADADELPLDELVEEAKLAEDYTEDEALEDVKKIIGDDSPDELVTVEIDEIPDEDDTE